MKYLQVNPGSDQVRKPGKRYDILVANELYTLKQAKQFTDAYRAAHFTLLEVSSHKTHYIFGARFKDGII
jgi:hypothetical protein